MNKSRKQKRSFAALIIPGILVLIAVASMLFFQYYTAGLTRQLAYQSLSDSALEQTATLREIFNGRFTVLEVFANRLANQKPTPDFEEIAAHMNDIIQASDFEHMAVAGLDGVVYTHDDLTDDSSDRFYMSEALAGRRAVQKPTDSRLYQKKRIVLSYPLFKNGQVAGVVLGSFPDMDLEQLLISSAFGGNAFSLLCDSAGNVIVEAEKPGTQYEQDNLLIELGSGDVDYFDETTLKNISADLQNGAGGLAAYAIDGVKRYVVYQPTGINDWFIFNVVPSDVVERPMITQNRLGIL